MTTRSQYRRYSQPEYRALAEVLSQFKNPSGMIFFYIKCRKVLHFVWK